MTRPTTRRAALAAAVVPALTLLAACGSDEGPGAEPGRDGLSVVADVRPSSVTGREVWLQAPTGQVRAMFGEPVDEVDGESAGPGMVLVPYVVEDVPREGVPGVVFRLLAGSDLAPDVAVRAGGEEVDLGTASGVTSAPTLDSRPGYLRVPEDAAGDLALEVGFDGLRQRVALDGGRDAGAAESLYALPPSVAAACDEGWSVAGRPRADVAAECRAEGTAYPYLPGTGWNEDPSAPWGLVVLDNRFVFVDPGRGGVDPTCRSLDVASVELTAAGEGAVPLDLGQGDGVALPLRDDAWPVLTATVEATCDTSGGPDALTLTRDLEVG